MSVFRKRSFLAGAIVSAVMASSLQRIAGAANNESPRSLFYQAKQSHKSETRQRLFARGMTLAKKQLATRPADPRAMFWLAVNMASEALERGKMQALPVVPKMEALLLKVDRMDPTFDEGAPARVLGRLYHQAPAVISVGSNEKAQYFLQKALSIAPKHPGNLAFAAHLFMDEGQDDRALAMAKHSLALLPQHKPAPHSVDAEEWAKVARLVIEDLS